VESCFITETLRTFQRFCHEILAQKSLGLVYILLGLFYSDLLLRHCGLFSDFAMRSLKQSWMVRELDLIVRSPRLYSRHLRIAVRSLLGLFKLTLGLFQGDIMSLLH
jgi:hypothetical protein